MLKAIQRFVANRIGDYLAEFVLENADTAVIDIVAQRRRIAAAVAPWQSTIETPTDAIERVIARSNEVAASAEEYGRIATLLAPFARKGDGGWGGTLARVLRECEAKTVERAASKAR